MLAGPDKLWISEDAGDYLLRLSLTDCRHTGPMEIGPGIVARIRTRGDGVFYLLMGRTGGVVRVDTR